MKRIATFWVVMGILLVASFRPAEATTIDVNTVVDSRFSGDAKCSLREAIMNANTDSDTTSGDCAAGSGRDFIRVPAGIYRITISAVGHDNANYFGDFDILQDLTIIGEGAGQTIIDGDGIDRVFDIRRWPPDFDDVHATIAELTVRNGKAKDVVVRPGGGQFLEGKGGGIRVDSSTSLLLVNSTVTGNEAPFGFGGGVYSVGSGSLHIFQSDVSGNSAGDAGGGVYKTSGELLVSSSTISGNSADDGGGIYRSTGDSTVVNSTISGNSADVGGGIYIRSRMTIDSSTITGNSAGGFGGGGIFTPSGTTPGIVTARNTIIANNTDRDCVVLLDNIGNNMDSDGTCNFAITAAAPLLGPLVFNGGPTRTHALLPGSPAIEAGSLECPPPLTDQRDIDRPQACTCDIGAYEFDDHPPDVEPPTWDLPGDITTNPDAGMSTALVDYTATPSDDICVLSSACSPASGSEFPLGNTWVTCTAEDAVGNGGGGTFLVTVIDSEPPTWELPGNITVTTDAGISTALVDYTATAADNVGVISSSCAPASGSLFALGVTPVNCTASDAAGNVGTDSFLVTVIDAELPTWELPADITVLAAELAGASVPYTATAADNVGVISSSCAPASGSLFALGVTPVNCTASDAAGNVATDSFNITVEVDQSSVDTLSDGIDALGLPKGVEKSLNAALKQVRRLINDGNPNNDGAACNKLDDFLLKVQEQLADGSLAPDQANQLSTFAHALKIEVGCI